MKKLLIFVSVFASILISCGDKKDAGNTANNGKDIVLITMDSLDQHWLSVKKGAEEKAKELGLNLIFRAPAGKTDPNEQTRMVEDAINQKAAAILLAPTDGTALAPVAKKVMEAGIPLILIDSPISTEDYTAILSTDNYAAGSLAADTLAKLLNNKGKIAIVHPQAGASSVINRGKGFEDQIKKIAPNIQIVSVQYSDGDKARALNIATDIMTANPDLAGFFTSNEGSTVGVARALENAGKKDTIMLVGFDKSDDTIKALENGTLKATMVQNPELMGTKGVEYANMYIMKSGEAPRKTDTGVTVITLENIDLIK